MMKARTFSRRALFLATAVAPLLAAAQSSDEFASDGGPCGPFAHIIEEHPPCAGPVYEYWAKTEELNELFQQRKRSVNPEATELGNQINETAKERSSIADEIIDCVKDDVMDARPPLEGRVEQIAPFDLRVEESDDPQEPVVLRERTPQLDAREPGLNAPPAGRLPEEKVTGVLLPRPRQDRSGPAPSGGGEGADPAVELDVRGKIVGTGGHPGGTGGTVVNDFTRKYAFAQGMLLGVGDAGQTAGGRFAQLMIASGYLVMGDPQRAEHELGLVPGQSVTLADLNKDLEEFSKIINEGPTADLEQSRQNGRTLGKKLTETFMGKYGPPPLQPPSNGDVINPFQPGATPSAAR